jgi:hypothetical protein
MTVLIDTNPLVRGAQPGNAQYSTAMQAVERLSRSGESLVLAPQNLFIQAGI